MTAHVSFLAHLRATVVPRLVPPLVALLLATSGGCLATNVKLAPAGGSGRSAVLVRVYADADAVDQGRKESAGTLVELFAVDARGKEVFLQRSLAGEWGIDELPPGKYRLRVVALLDGAGHLRDANPGDRETDFTLDAGQTAEVNVVLKKTPTGLLVLAAVTVVVLVVALALILQKGHGNPKPPRFSAPPLSRGAPPPVPLRAVVVAPEIWVDPLWGPPPPDREPSPPRATSVVPESGAVVADRHVVPTVTFSQPLDVSRVSPDTLAMLGSRSGLIPGRTVVENGLVRFQPSLSLAPSEVVTVTVRSRGIVNRDGRGLESDFSWSFSTAP